jgi:hypothetical protein
MPVAQPENTGSPIANPRPPVGRSYHRSGASRDRTDDLLLAKRPRRRSGVDQMPVSPVITGFASDLRIV